MSGFLFEIEGITIAVADASGGVPAIASVLERLREDFAGFGLVQGERNEASIRLDLLAEPPGDRSIPSFHVFSVRGCQVYGWDNPRYCAYEPGSGVICREVDGRRHYQVWGGIPDRLHEVCYLALLSALGEYLDRKGAHRVHGLGIQFRGKGALLVAPSGGGKSALATLLLRGHHTELYSEESPLIRDGELVAFPTRIALSAAVASALSLVSKRRLVRHFFGEKLLFPFPSDRKAAPSAVRDVFFVRGGRFLEPRIYRCTRLQGFYLLLLPLVVGQGLAQMAEFVLRFRNLPSLLLTALRRLHAANQLAGAANCWIFETTPDAYKNAEALEKFLER